MLIMKNIVILSSVMFILITFYLGQNVYTNHKKKKIEIEKGRTTPSKIHTTRSLKYHAYSIDKCLFCSYLFFL